MKKINTNYIAYGILAVFIGGLALVFTGKATLGEVSEFGAGIVAILTAYGFLKAADKKGGVQ